MQITLQLEQTKIRFNTVSHRMHISQGRTLFLENFARSKMPKLVSSETLLLENDKSFACGDEHNWPILEDPALLLGIFWKQTEANKKTIMPDKKQLNKQSTVITSRLADATLFSVSFLTVAFREVGTTEGAVAARIARASLCLLSEFPRFLASLRSRRN